MTVVSRHINKNQPQIDAYNIAINQVKTLDKDIWKKSHIIEIIERRFKKDYILEISEKERLLIEINELKSQNHYLKETLKEYEQSSNSLAANNNHKKESSQMTHHHFINLNVNLKLPNGTDTGRIELNDIQVEIEKTKNKGLTRSQADKNK